MCEQTEHGWAEAGGRGEAAAGAPDTPNALLTSQLSLTCAAPTSAIATAQTASLASVLPALRRCASFRLTCAGIGGRQAVGLRGVAGRAAGRVRPEARLTRQSIRRSVGNSRR